MEGWSSDPGQAHRIQTALPIEEANLPPGVLRVARVVGHHAAGRALVVQLGIHKCAEWGCVNLWTVPPTPACGSCDEIKQAAEALEKSGNAAG